MTVIINQLVHATRSAPPSVTGPRELGRRWVQSADIANGGRYQVTGTVKITPDSPTHRKVTLFDAVSRLLIREQWSDPITGAYAFTRIRAGVFFVVAVDYTHTYNAVIADNITAELMP